MNKASGPGKVLDAQRRAQTTAIIHLQPAVAVMHKESPVLPDFPVVLGN